MSDGVRDLTQAQRNSMNVLQRKNKGELERVNRLHDKNVKELKLSQEQELHQTRDHHLVELAQEVQNKEQKLQALRQSQEQTQRLTEAETQRQVGHANRVREEARERASNDMEKTKLVHEENIHDLNLRFNESTRDLTLEGRHRLHQQQDQNRTALSAQGNEWRHRLDQQRDKYQTTFKAEGEKFDHLTEQQKQQNIQQSKLTHLAHQNKMTKMNQEHVKFSDDVTNQHQKSLVEKEQFFEKKYQTQLGQHAHAEKNLETRYQDVVNQSKEDLNKRVAVEKNRSGDPFFAFTELRPSLQEHPDHYILKVPTPEYAKEEVTLTANHKELVLTSNRRYQDERKDLDGTLKKVNKVESMVSRIPVNQVLDPRKMTKEWVDGELVFNIRKA